MIRVYGSTFIGKGSSSITFDEDAFTFINTAKITERQQQKAVNELVEDLKKTGIWNKLTAVYPFVGGNGDAHSYNLKNPEKYRFTWGSLAEHSLLGVVPHTQAHHNNLPVSDISSNAGNDVSVHMYVDDNDNASETVDVYSTVISNSINLTVYLYSIGKYIRFDCGNGTSNSLTLSDVDASGFMSLTSIQNKLSAYRNGACIGEKVNNPGNIQSLIARFNYDSTTRNNCKYYRFLSWGRGLTSVEMFILNKVIQKYQTNLNRAIETGEIADTDAAAFIEAAKIKNPDQQLAINYLTYSLKSAGLWDKFTTLYPLVGGKYDSCKYNLIDVAQHMLSDAEGIVYSKKGLKPTNNIKIGLFNDLFPDYNTASKESSFDMYIQEEVESATHDFGFEETKNGFCIFSNYTGKEVYYLSAYTGNTIAVEDCILKNVNVPTNGLFSGQSKTGNLSVYKNGQMLVSETKTPKNVPDEPVFIMKNIRTLSLVATRKSNLTDAEFITYRNIIRTYQRILDREVTYKPVLSLNFNSLPILDSCGKTTVTNNGVILSEGKTGTAGKFNNGFLNLDRTVYAGLIASGTYTIEFWLKLDSTQSIILFGSCRSGDYNAPATVAVTNNTLYFVYNSNWKYITVPIDTGEWRFVRIVVDNFEISVYIDEQLKGTGTLSGTLATWPLYMGGQTASSGSGLGQTKFAGMIDEFYLYDIAKHP